MAHRDDFDDDLMDASDDAYDFRPVSSDEGSGSKALKLIIAVSVVAGLAGGAWYMVGSSPTDGDDVPIVRASPTPTKEKPNDPGGMKIANRDKTIYDRVSGDNTEPKLERLLPLPEKPLEKPVASLELPAPAEPEKSEPVVPEANVEVPNQTVQPVENMPETPSEEMAEEIKAPPPAPVIDENAPMALVKSSEQPKGPDQQDKDDLSAKIAEALNEQSAEKPAVVTEKEAKAPEPVKVAKTEPAKTGFVLQLLSSKSKSGVEQTWQKIKSKNGDIVNPLDANIVKADLGDKGIYYRLRLGPVPTGTKAKEVCAQLKKRDVGCFIVKLR